MTGNEQVGIETQWQSQTWELGAPSGRDLSQVSFLLRSQVVIATFSLHRKGRCGSCQGVYPKAQTNEQTEIKQVKSHGILLEIPNVLKLVILCLSDEAGLHAATGATRSFFHNTNDSIPPKRSSSRSTHNPINAMLTALCLPQPEALAVPYVFWLLLHYSSPSCLVFPYCCMSGKDMFVCPFIL